MRFALVVVPLVACGGDLDPQWQLDHDRIIAVRATPPAIVSGETSAIDGLIAVKGGPTAERPPDLATVVSPTSLAGALAFVQGQWIVTAPDETGLAAARTELGIADGMPVPMRLGISYNGTTLVGLKTVSLGLSATNPTMPTRTIDDAPAPDPGTPLTIGTLVDVPLHVDALDTDDVNWLTSCGTLHDDDLPMAHLRVEVDDPTEGELALVVRDNKGGVTWQVWPIHAE